MTWTDLYILQVTSKSLLDQGNCPQHSNCFCFLTNCIHPHKHLNWDANKEKLTNIGNIELIVENNSHDGHGSSRDLLLYNLQSLHDLLVLRRQLVVRNTLESKIMEEA